MSDGARALGTFSRATSITIQSLLQTNSNNNNRRSVRGHRRRATTLPRIEVPIEDEYYKEPPLDTENKEDADLSVGMSDQTLVRNDPKKSLPDQKRVPWHLFVSFHRRGNGDGERQKLSLKRETKALAAHMHSDEELAKADGALTDMKPPQLDRNSSSSRSFDAPHPCL
jgi:hypothetical protein